MPEPPMTMPVRSLPVAQNWDCSGCGRCCKSYQVPVTAEERKRIEGQGWEADPDFAGVPYFASKKSLLGGTEYHLNHRPDGSCVFLGADGLCRIHAKHGAAAKPMACRVYPFLLVPAGDHWRVGLRYACPMAAEGTGRPLSEHVPDVRKYAAGLEAHSPGVVNAPPIPLKPRQLVPWADVLRVAAVVSRALDTTAEPLERRWRKVIGLAALGRTLRFDGKGDPTKAITGGRLSELLHVLGQAVDEETPPAAEVSPPGWAGRVLFRQAAALYARKDHEPDKGTAQRTLLGRFQAALRFARGSGVVPKVNAAIPDGATFAAAEEPAGPLSKEADAVLTRYYRVKVESLQFCGPTNFGFPVWDGLESLALTFPAVLWQARVLAFGGARSKDEAIVRAVRLVDDNFGFNPLLGMVRQKAALRMLAARGDLPRLVAWYAR